MKKVIYISFITIVFSFCIQKEKVAMEVHLPNDGCGIYLIVPSKNSNNLSNIVVFDSSKVKIISYESINEFKGATIKVTQGEKDVTKESEIASAIFSNNGNEIRCIRIELKCENSRGLIEELELDYILNKLNIVQ